MFADAVVLFLRLQCLRWPKFCSRDNEALKQQEDSQPEHSSTRPSTYGRWHEVWTAAAGQCQVSGSVAAWLWLAPLPQLGYEARCWHRGWAAAAPRSVWSEPVRKHLRKHVCVCMLNNANQKLSWKERTCDQCLTSHQMNLWQILLLLVNLLWL